MEQATLKLPIRLVPRRGAQAGLLALSAGLAAFAVYWIGDALGESRRFIADGAGGFDYWLNLLPPLVAGIFLAMCVLGMIRSILKMLPASPYYHLALYPEGLVVQAPFRRRRFAWGELPAFETIEVVRRSKYGRRYTYFTVARAADESGRMRELLRVHADEYGAKKSQEDADALTAWLNALHARGVNDRLKNGEAIEIPAQFRAVATPLTPRLRQGPDAPGQAAARSERPPTVQRQ
ncbi:MAG TPA: hypothetical protein PLR41_12435 [Alphaproteobacteria bacterium]|nr:hypothetical protein [Alphaproteobacteria bacterium]